MYNSNINVLHLCSYYYGSRLYENLFTNLGERDIKQTAYIPIKNNLDIGKINLVNNCNFIVKETSNNLDRFFFNRKAKKNYLGLISDIKINNFNIVHAHTLFTNGYIAYRLYKEFNIPYIVAVRNTDVNVFFKYFFNLRNLGVEILKNSKKVIFISPSYMENTIEKYVPNEYKQEIKNKSLVIPNGLNEYWIKNKSTKPKKLDKDLVKLVYIGEVTKNKNIHKVINDVKKMNSSGMNVRYTIVGDGDYLDNIKQLAKTIKVEDYVNILGRINDKDRIKDILNENDIFVMNSSFETFGLSYIEALSMGLPVIYTKYQGIYGYYDEGYIGYGVERDTSIEDTVKKIVSKYDCLSINAIGVAGEFDWGLIADKYVQIYKNIGIGG